jgi:hypothetical protein
MSKNLLMATLAAGLSACEVGSGPEMSRLSVQLTVAPSLAAASDPTAPPSPAIASAAIWISTVYLIGGDETSRDTIKTGPTTMYDLSSLQNGVNTLLGDQTIVAGDYAQLRLVVDSAKVTLSGETETRTLFVPSGMQTGIKVNFSGPLSIKPPQVVVLVTFDPTASFVVTGPTPPRQVLFNPVLHGTVTP